MEKLFCVPLKLNKVYLRGSLKKSANGVSGSFLSTDTYFGCFPCEAYFENTSVRNIKACVIVKGSGTVELCHLDKDIDETVATEQFSFDSYSTIVLPAALKHSGILYIKAVGDLEITKIWYEGDGEVKKTNISVIICTYNREEYVLKNLKILSRYADDNLNIICVDNGRTLNNVPNGVHLIKNKNYGGSGGYARGMLEAKGSTHFWLMDDDIKFEPEIISRAVGFIKHRKKENIYLAAGMFSFEKPTVQHEATAVFDGYTFHSNAGGLDFRDRNTLIENRINQKKNTYGGWWSLIMPAKEELPMPFFIKLDDVEYGIRTDGDYVIMNGFGVWHEAFGKKGNAWSEYYTTRNTLIIQNMYPDLPHSTVKMMSIRLLKALAYGEPKCMEAVIRGVRDYIAGSEKFRSINPENRHKEIMDLYRAPLTSDMSRKKMLKAAFINILNPINWRSIRLFVKAVSLLKNDKPDAGWKNLASEEFWRAYLGV